MEKKKKVYEGKPYDAASEALYNHTSVLTIVGDAFISCETVMVRVS